MAVTALQAELGAHFVPYMFENCADETWQLERFPTSRERSKLKKQMDMEDLKEALPVLASSEDEDFGVTWLEDPPTSGLGGRSRPKASAAHTALLRLQRDGVLRKRDRKPISTRLQLHILIPKFGRGIRRPAKSPTALARSKPTPRKSKSRWK